MKLSSAYAHALSRCAWILVFSALFLCVTAMTVQGQTFPSKPIRIVVPFPPGGSTDLLARRIGERLATVWGQPVIVENRAGAGGTVGADYVAKANPDGYTLLMGVTGSNAISAALYPKLPYNVLKDFSPISMVVSSPLVLVKNGNVKAGNLKELVVLAKAKPGHFSYGSPGNGTSMHLTGEMFELSTGIAMVHIPYRGSAGALTDLMGGQIDTMFGDFLVVMPQIQAGKIQALAVTSKKRHPLLPEVPTVSASGFPGFEALSWQGFFAPAGTSQDVIAKLSTEINNTLKSPEIQEYFGSRGFIIEGNSPSEFKSFIEAEVLKWTRIVKESGAKPD